VINVFHSPLLVASLIVVMLISCNLPSLAPVKPKPSGPMPSQGAPLSSLTSTTPRSSASQSTQEASLSGVGLEPAGEADTYWVMNPSSGARLHVQVFHPQNWNGSDHLPALALIPGGVGRSEPDKAARLAGRGFLVIVFDPDGRGKSEGREDYNGYLTQDGLAAVITAAASLPGLDAGRYGLVSYSYGVTAASGVLARYPDLPIDFYIDWEGPVDRHYTTSGCTGVTHNIDWQPCSDDAWWSQREAVNFIGDAQVPYQRIQSQTDHVQPNNNHAIDIVNSAVAGGVPWVRLNEYPPNQTYTASNPPAMLPDVMDGRIDALLADYARYIIETVLPSMK
jgi:pimeloyl-ACP methyl ester carboxylesterase